jgi:hypothetical protein
VSSAEVINQVRRGTSLARSIAFGLEGRLAHSDFSGGLAHLPEWAVASVADVEAIGLWLDKECCTDLLRVIGDDVIHCDIGSVNGVGIRATLATFRAATMEGSEDHSLKFVRDSWAANPRSAFSKASCTRSSASIAGIACEPEGSVIERVTAAREARDPHTQASGTAFASRFLPSQNSCRDPTAPISREGNWHWPNLFLMRRNKSHCLSLHAWRIEPVGDVHNGAGAA